MVNWWFLFAVLRSGSKLPTEMRLVAQAYGGVICGITDNVPGTVAVAAPEDSADSESDSDSSAGSSEFRRRLDRQRKELGPELGRSGGKKAAGACHKLKTKDKTRPAARRSTRQLEREKATAGQQGGENRAIKLPDQQEDGDSLFQDASLEAIESEVEVDSSVLSPGTVSSVASSAVPQIIGTPVEGVGLDGSNADNSVLSSTAPASQVSVVIPTQQASVVTSKVVMVSPQQLQRVQLPVANNNSSSRPHKIQVCYYI